MFNKKYIIGALVVLSFLIGTTSSLASTQMPEKTTQFRRIEQPMSLKIGVTLGGLALIGTELWWFVFSRTKYPQAPLDKNN
ncbi:MAG: hypothetical protein KME01_02840 [Chroococcus sp. CMT-3BRIN-NPC107]|jgi:plastocyanin domain-containing protein|nr:hypothetical protein [Chroococcus sp. CMT-3BRIN-NPC107]